ncbi:DUF1176 domain-containing protein [Stenotrophomonas maltophilia]|uniref:DUF1176 domain-containing protein n=1 Tax=Stenotrophomonas maltophilia group TaxID=995085 RepID=UPI000D49033E|nr:MULTISPECIES: DUF1176 domain-containing protein [Stenotrophomonas maltophilia group]MCF3498551.1 DUF1176 domain-containing protein [Stenotrophomonas maltophilia]MDQ4680015.1 DUF1176 domain-containing protein [Stenotrophomonas maltophilia group sp. RNC7]PSD15195.1 DUF1176 domain-containing protein [Stenotrophomonas maltophilia]UGB23443.1 DUF1176 domain-containing protein [Stenotrophomonas maltophilia]
MTRTLLTALMALTVASAAHSATPEPRPGVEFEHNDWSLACDNTRTCRAAGYSPQAAGNLLSLMLERAGGPGTKVLARLRNGEDGESPTPTGALRLHLNGKDLGPVRDTGDGDKVLLQQAQTDALVAVLPREARIEIIDGEGKAWPISDRGAAAVLLKMDEAQGRLDTPGALVRRGDKPETSVPAALPVPVIMRGTLVAPRASDAALANAPGLRKALIASLPKPDECARLSEGGTDEIEIQRLDAQHVLASTSCFMGAYNFSSGYWVVQDRAPYQAKFVTSNAEDFDRDDATLRGRFRGRGIGDCFSGHDWAWDSARFVKSGEFTTGQCRGVAGGHWQLPTVVSEVR